MVKISTTRSVDRRISRWDIGIDIVALDATREPRSESRDSRALRKRLAKERRKVKLRRTLMKYYLPALNQHSLSVVHRWFRSQSHWIVSDQIFPVLVVQDGIRLLKKVEQLASELVAELLSDLPREDQRPCSLVVKGL